jgi:predicted alpha-1,6-mannanase (GH76 family)
VGREEEKKKNKRNVGSFTRRESFKITRHYYYFHAWTVIYSRRVALLLSVYTDDAAPGVFNEDEEGWKDDGSAPLIIMIVSTLLYTKYIAEREREREMPS